MAEINTGSGGKFIHDHAWVFKNGGSCFEIKGAEIGRFCLKELVLVGLVYLP